jgi:prophage tail gpP-like protein
VDLVAVLDGLIAHLARLGALQFDLMIGTKPFQHGIEALTRPGKQVTKTVDGGPIVTFSDAVIDRLKLLALGLRL